MSAITSIINVTKSGSNNTARVQAWGIRASCTAGAHMAVGAAVRKLAARAGRDAAKAELKCVSATTTQETWLAT